jgi:Integrase core domain
VPRLAHSAWRVPHWLWSRRLSGLLCPGREVLRPVAAGAACLAGRGADVQAGDIREDGGGQLGDRARQFTSSFDAAPTAQGITIPASPPQSPKANAICERLTGTLRRKVPGRLLTVNEQHLHKVLTEYLRHHNTARPHRSLSQLTPAQAGTCPPETVNPAEHRIRRKQVPAGPRRTHPRVPRRCLTTRGPRESYFRAPQAGATASDLVLSIGAGDENRTRTVSLFGDRPRGLEARFPLKTITQSRTTAAAIPRPGPASGRSRPPGGSFA